MVRLVLFDIDGTLISTAGAGVRAFGEAFAATFGIRNGTAEMNFAGRTDTGLARELFARHGVAATSENLQHFFNTYVFWLDHLVHHLPGRVLPGVADFLAEVALLAQPPARGLLTGNIRLGAEIKLRRFGLWQAFEMGAFGDDSEDRNLIATVAHERGRQHLKRELRGEDILVIGDTPHDISCGRAIGARVLAVATGGSKAEQLAESKPDWLVADLTQIDVRTVCG